jgi:hypothetical protein
MRLRPGVDAEAAAADLRSVISAGAAAEASAGQPEAGSTGHIVWVGELERVLSSNFVAVPLARLYSPRFGLIAAGDSPSPRLAGLIADEVKSQVAWLSSVAELLETEVRKASASDASVAVPDTNVLLHYLPVEQIDWARVVNAESVRIAIPCRVVDELDGMKFGGQRQDLRDQAAVVIRRLEELLEGPASASAELRPGITIEVVQVAELLPGLNVEPVAANVEILDTCEALTALSSRPVCLISGDLGMRYRARERGIRAVAMPGDYLRHRSFEVPERTSPSIWPYRGN